MPIQSLSSENVLLWISYQLFLFPFKNVCLNCFHKNAELDFPTMLIFNFTKLPCTPFFEMFWSFCELMKNLTWLPPPRGRGRFGAVPVPYSNVCIRIAYLFFVKFQNSMRTILRYALQFEAVRPSCIRPENQTPTCMILIEYRYLAYRTVFWIHNQVEPRIKTLDNYPLCLLLLFLSNVQDV